MPRACFQSLACTLLLLTLLSAPRVGRAEDPGEHDFGDSIVVFTLEYEDDLLPEPPWALAKARVRRLGNVYFLTGIVPDGRTLDGRRADGTRKHWIPLADVVRMAEFPDVESAREAFEIAPAEEDSRPVIHRTGRRGAARREGR